MWARPRLAIQVRPLEWIQWGTKRAPVAPSCDKSTLAEVNSSVHYWHQQQRPTAKPTPCHPGSMVFNASLSVLSRSKVVSGRNSGERRMQLKRFRGQEEDPVLRDKPVSSLSLALEYAKWQLQKCNATGRRTDVSVSNFCNASAQTHRAVCAALVPPSCKRMLTAASCFLYTPDICRYTCTLGMP